MLPQLALLTNETRRHYCTPVARSEHLLGVVEPRGLWGLSVDSEWSKLYPRQPSSESGPLCSTPNLNWNHYGLFPI